MPRLTGETRRPVRIEVLPSRPILTRDEGLLRKQALVAGSPVALPPALTGSASPASPVPATPDGGDAPFRSAILAAMNRIAEGQAELLAAVKDLAARISPASPVAPAPEAAGRSMAPSGPDPSRLPASDPRGVADAPSAGPILSRKEGRVRLGSLSELAAALGPDDFMERSSPRSASAAPAAEVDDMKLVPVSAASRVAKPGKKTAAGQAPPVPSADAPVPRKAEGGARVHGAPRPPGRGSPRGLLGAP